MLLFEGGIPAWQSARMPMDGTEAPPEKYAEAAELKQLLSAKPPPQLVDLRSSAAAKAAPLKGALVTPGEKLISKLKGTKKVLLLVADQDLEARIVRSRLIAAQIPAEQIFVVRGGKRALDEARKPGAAHP